MDNLKLGAHFRRKALEIFLSCPFTVLALKVQLVVSVNIFVRCSQFD